MKTILVAILALLACGTAHAYPSVNSVEFSVNHGGINSPVNAAGTWLTKKHPLLLKCTYDFAKQGGASGTLILKDMDGSSCVLPAKAVVFSSLIDIVTSLTSGGSPTVAIGTGAATNDIKVATAYGSFTSGLMAGVPVGTAASAVKVASQVNPSLTIAGGSLTAGKINVFLVGFLSD